MNQSLLMSMLLTVAPVAAAAAEGKWERLPPLPDKEGFAGMYAGVSHGALLAAGGANFPDKKPWEGGKKIWYDDVYVLEAPDGQWRKAGTLPRPMGYGVSVTYNDGVICVGGSDADRHYTDVFRLEWKDGKLLTTPLPPLPKPVANACGVVEKGMLYVAGGLEKPDATEALATVYSIDLSAEKPVWNDGHPAIPGNGRMLAVAAVVNGRLQIAGGTELVRQADGSVARRYLREVQVYAPKQGWGRGGDLPRAAVAAPSPAPVVAGGVYILGGDDGTQVNVAPAQHKGFSRSLLRLDVGTEKWSNVGELPVGHVTAPCVRWGDAWVIVSGEIRPGIRSPEVWSWRPQTPQ